MNLSEAKAIVSAGRHLPTQYAWLVKQAENVVNSLRIDTQARLSQGLPTMTLAEWDRQNMALAARLARCCQRRDWLWADTGRTYTQRTADSLADA